MTRRWLIEKLEEQWNPQAAEALNRFLRRSEGGTSERIQATTLLLHRGAVEEEATRALASSGLKEHRWLARYIQVIETERQNVDAFAWSDLTQRLTLSTLSP
jgi:hypothetical protein